MSTLQTIISEAKKEFDDFPIREQIVVAVGEDRDFNDLKPIVEEWVEKQITKAFLSGQQSVLERARWMKIPKEFESKWNYYQGYSYEWAIGYNRMADDLLSAPLNDIEI